MFLVQSYHDQRAYIVDHDGIECNGKQIHEIMKGDEVLFKLGKKQYEGKVIDNSSNSKHLKTQMTTFNKTIEGTRKKSNYAEVLRSKRKHVPKKSWTPPDSPSPKKSKTMDTKIETKGGKDKDIKKQKPANKPIDSSPSSSGSSDISEENDNEKETLYTEPQLIISPTKDELKQQIAILEANQAKHKNTQEESRKLSLKRDNVLTAQNWNDLNKSKPSNASEEAEKKSANNLSSTALLGCDDAEENANSAHLFPPEFDGGKMTNIGNNVYCRNVIYDSATGASKKATHIARRLLEGIFTHESLMNCTLTGQAPRGKDKKSDVAITPLDKRGKDATVDFAIRYAAAKNLPKQNSSTILKEMSQRITEYKRNHNNAIAKSNKKDD